MKLGFFANDTEAIPLGAKSEMQINVTVPVAGTWVCISPPYNRWMVHHKLNLRRKPVLSLSYWDSSKGEWHETFWLYTENRAWGDIWGSVRSVIAESRDSMIDPSWNSAPHLTAE